MYVWRRRRARITEGKIRAGAVWNILGVEPGRRSQYDNERMGAAMRQLGWKRSENSIRFGLETARGYTKGDGADEIIVCRDPDVRNSLCLRIGQPPHVKGTRMIVDGVVGPDPNF